MPSDFFTRHSNVYLFVPNLIGATRTAWHPPSSCLQPRAVCGWFGISPAAATVTLKLINPRPEVKFLELVGYARVLATFASLAVADVSPLLCLVAYFVSFACDELDGRFARKFGQTSKMGTVLDMATDRVSTAGLLALLCKYCPSRHPVWIALIMLDVGSHWFHMYASLAAGDSSHKVRTSTIQIAMAEWCRCWLQPVRCGSTNWLGMAMWILMSVDAAVFSSDVIWWTLMWIRGRMRTGSRSRGLQAYSAKSPDLSAVRVQDVKGANWLIRMYYTQRVFMGFCCVSCEVLYLSCFLLSHRQPTIVTSEASPNLLRAVRFVTGSSVNQGDMAVCYVIFAMLPGWLVKQIVNVHQAKASMDRLVALESKAA
jgi:phosphatidylglycerophosphate synthase